MPTPADRLRERIRREGPISFLDFMEAALYGPDGYYTSGARIGQPGDFVTSPHVSPVFSRAIAERFLRDAQALEGPLDFVEVGAGGGQFLEDFASHVARRAPDLAARRLRLTAVERSAASREALERREICPVPRMLADSGDLAGGSVTGWIFSNELYDALPVARVVGTREGIAELRVGLGPDGFAWVPAPAPPSLEEHLAAFRVGLEEGQVAEVRPSAGPLHRRLSRALARGRLVAFDYGHRTRTLYHPAARPFGTLAVHSGGRRGGDPLENPGATDLTAHVHWDDLVAAGEAEGLATDGVFRQGRYLAESGVMDLAGDEREKWRAFRLIDPEGMGEEISVLLQSRGLAMEELDSPGPSDRMPGR